ncbi:MAG: helix-turn-helix transcriptional regulator [Candidatus Aminicenantaceae bacterium]
MAKNILGNTIKVQRAKKDLTQEQLSEIVGVTRTTINLIERRKFVPSAVIALKIAIAFEVPFEEVFFLDENKSSE